MSITFIILFSFLNVILNIPSPIEIKSSAPFYITSNETLFKFDYTSIEKTDMIFTFKPYLNFEIYGKIELSTNMDVLRYELEINNNEKIFTQSFLFKRQNYITINSSNPFNKGKGNYYIYLIGNLQCSFEIFLLNEIKNLDVKESYYFTNFFNTESQNYHSLKVQNLTENIYMYILAYNNSCSFFEITENNKQIECDSEIPNLLLLEQNKDYIIKYNLDNFNYFSINFINYKSEYFQSLNEENKSKSFIALRNSIFNFSIYIKDLKVDNYFGFLIDYPIKFSLEGNYAENEDFQNFKSIKKKTGYNYFIFQKGNFNYSYFIFKIKFLTSHYNPIKIYKLDEIHFINKLPFVYNIVETKTYLFFFTEDLLNYFKNYNSFIKLKFDHDNSMNIYSNGHSKIFKEKIYVSKLGEINAISFSNTKKEGIFEISMLSEDYNELINSNYFISEAEKVSVRINDKGEYIEIVGSENSKIFYCNLVMGNIDFYEIFDLSENKTDKKVDYKGIKTLINQTLILKAIINSYSIYEIFIQNNVKKYHFISNSKMIYFSKYVKYNIFPSFENMKIDIKLINQNSELVIISKKDKIILNSTNLFIELDNFTQLDIEGNDSLVYFFVSLSNSSDYLISNSNNAEINNLSEIFIIPQKTNYDIINLIITVTQSEKDEIVLYYIVDYNIIPYSRNKNDIINKIILKRGEKEYILINNYIKNDKADHLSNENFYIYLLFDENIDLIYQLNYSNYHILKENEQILIPSGQNKIYIGYEKINYLKFDKCGEQNISLDIFQNEEKNEENIIVSDERGLISCTKNEKEGYLSLEVNSKNNFLLSLSHQNISMLDSLIYDYDIDLAIDNIKKKVIINYKPVSNFPHIEYHVFMVDKIYYNNLTDHCFINKYINDIYVKKFIFLSNGKQEMFSQQLKIEGDIKCDDVYSFLILAKEVINGYTNYHYYNPKTIYISEIICNAEPEPIYPSYINYSTNLPNSEYETIYPSYTRTNDVISTKDIIIELPKNETSYFILGIDNFNHDKVNKKGYFNLFFVFLGEESFSRNIFFYVVKNNIKTVRNLENEGNEDGIIKTKCNLSKNEIKNQVKYQCEFDTLGEDKLSIKSLDIIEVNSKKIEIQNSSFLHSLYKNNIENAVENIFNKSIFILEDSIITSNKKEFNITGKLDREMNHTKIIFQFHPYKESGKILKSNCRINNLDNKKYILQCIPKNQINSKIVDGYSNLGDSHLIVMYNDKNNKIQMDSSINRDYPKSSNGLSVGAIIAIIISSLIVFLGIIVAIIFIIKKKNNNTKENNTNIENPNNTTSENKLRF